MPCRVRRNLGLPREPIKAVISDQCSVVGKNFSWTGLLITDHCSPTTVLQNHEN
jgi:hypothetical protein